MNGMIKKFMVMMLAVVMVFGMVITPAEAKNGKGRKPQPTPETTVEPDVQETPVAEETVEGTEEPGEPDESAEEELPAGETVSEETEPVDEGIVSEEPVETAVEEAPADEAVKAEAEVPNEGIVEAEENKAVEELAEEASADENVEVEAEEIEAVEEPAAVNSLALAKVGLLAEEPPLGAAGDMPAHEKTLTNNNDGTYRLALNVTGQAEKKAPKINAIVIVDRSGSMDTQSGTDAYVPTNGTGRGLYGLIDGEYVPLERRGTTGDRTFWYNDVQYTGQRYQYDATATRMQATQSAVIGLAETLLDYNGKDGNPDDTVQMALVSFATTAQTNVNPTTSYSTFSTAVIGLNANGGTNWEASLQQANGINFGDDDPTFVIFFSDGSPTFHSTDGGYNNWNNNYNVYGSGQEQEPNMERSYTQAVDDAAAIVTKVGANNFYTIFAYGTAAGATYMTNLTTSAGAPAGNNYSASSTAELNDAFAEILEKIEMAGFADVEIDDGTTNKVATSSGPVELLEVNENSYQYWRAGGEYGNGNGGLGSEWTDDDVPKAALVDGEVQWDLSSVGVLENGVTYTVTFEVYPSQYTYDTIARLKNGDIKYSDLPAEVRQYLIEDVPGVSYTLRTNTQAVLKYDDTRDDDPRKEIAYDNPDPVATSADTLTITKEWVGDNPPEVELPITVLMDGEEFHVAKLSTATDWKTETSISVGIIKNGEPLPGALGHDFSFAELDSTQYRWELDAPVVRPMLVNSVMTMLVKVDEKHPAPEGSETYEIEGSTYYADAAASGLTATNYRRSHLDVVKAVESAGPKDPNSDNVEFDFTIEVVNSRANTGTEADTGSDYYVWFSVADSNNDFNIVVEDDLVSGNVTRATNADGGYTGYYYMPSGTEIHVNMKDGYSIRFLNLPSGSSYTVTESATMPNEAYSFKDITVDTRDGQPVTYTAQTVEGTVVNANNPHTVTVTNTFTPSFYVYHSSDNTIEKISFADERVTRTYDETIDPETEKPIGYKYNFNIVDETLDGFLYGGYYTAYAGAGMKDEEIIASKAYSARTDTANNAYQYNAAATISENWITDSNGEAYNYQYIADNRNSGVWNLAEGIDTDGTKAVVEADKVYYLKEVPEHYILPYTYYTYFRTNYNIGDMWAITELDDLNYEEVGFVIEPDVKNSETVKVASNTLKITAKNTGMSVTLKPESLFKGFGVLNGYITYQKISVYKGVNITSLNQYWITKDGVTVYGIMDREISNITTVKAVSKTDSPIDPAYTAPSEE